MGNRDNIVEWMESRTGINGNRGETVAECHHVCPICPIRAGRVCPKGITSRVNCQPGRVNTVMKVMGAVVFAGSGPGCPAREVHSARARHVECARLEQGSGPRSAAMLQWACLQCTPCAGAACLRRQKNAASRARPVPLWTASRSPQHSARKSYVGHSRTSVPYGRHNRCSYAINKTMCATRKRSNPEQYNSI